MDANSTWPIDISRLCRICLLHSTPMRHIHEKLLNNDTMFSIIHNVTTLKMEDMEHFPKYICSSCELIVLQVYKLKVKFDQSQVYLDEYAKNMAKMMNMRNGTPKMNAKDQSCDKNGHEENIYEEIDIYEDLEEEDAKINNKENTDMQIQNKTEKNDKFSLKKGDVKVNNVVKDEEKSVSNFKDEKLIGAETKEEKLTKQDAQVSNFKKESVANNMQIKVEKEKPIEKEVPTYYLCALCGQSFKTGKELSDHKEKTNHVIKTELKCSLCNATIPYKQYNDHMNSHRNKFKCTVCFKRFFTQKDLDKHKILHNVKSNSSIFSDILGFCKTPQKTNLVCQVCKKSFLTKELLSKHQKLHLRDKKASKEHFSLLENLENSFNVSKCSTPYKSHKAMSSLRSYNCTHCTKTFFSKTLFKEHVLTHINYKTYTCKVCCKGFSKLSNLQMHELVHFDEKAYSCEVCSKRFSSKQALIMHKKLHVGPRFKCPICFIYFSDRSSWSRHVSIHI